MNQSELLHQMCQSLLSDADVKAICKNRGLPAHATTSRAVLESLFLSETGVAEAIAGLDPTEIALLHLLRAHGKPVDISFFSRLDPPKQQRWSYGTFTQRYQGVFSKVKERLVRHGVLILGSARETRQKETQMERWQFALPVQFEHYLPPLIQAARRLDGEGDWRADAGREQLIEVVRQGPVGQNKNDKFEIVDRQLLFEGKPFRAEQIPAWQKRHWLAETKPDKHSAGETAYTFALADAVAHILATLEAGAWCDADLLAAPLEAFCGFAADAEQVCESGWRWGCLARQAADGKTWYRLAPPPRDDRGPDQYLSALDGGSVAMDLESVGFRVMETLTVVSDLRLAPAGLAALLLTPSLVKLGRADDTVFSSPAVQWLQENSPAFRQAIEKLTRRRGKTIVHENLSVARVGDLALKVAIEKALGGRAVSLSDEFVAFPQDAVADVKRIVTRQGHVVKEASHRGS